MLALILAVPLTLVLTAIQILTQTLARILVLTQTNTLIRVLQNFLAWVGVPPLRLEIRGRNSILELTGLLWGFIHSRILSTGQLSGSGLRPECLITWILRCYLIREGGKGLGLHRPTERGERVFRDLVR